MPYERDLIAERDRKLKMQKTVVKWWDVKYVTEDEAEEEVKEVLKNDKQEETHVINAAEEYPGLTEEQMNAAQEIIDRLNREAAQDEAMKQAEIEAARIAAEEGYNPTTGSYSGLYGSGHVDEENLEQIGSILGEKEADFMRMMNEAK